MKLNKKNKNYLKTHNGAPAKRINAEAALRRSVFNCLLWEKEFYEDGELIADRIERLVPKVSPKLVVELAISARRDLYLRHVPLFLAVCMLKHDTHKGYVGKLLPQIIRRPDELTEVLAIYWRYGKAPLAKQLKIGLAEACHNFNEYQLAKWNRKKAEIKLKDVFRLVHPKPNNEKEAELFGKVVSDTLETPDTWETALSVPGVNKKAVWTRLLKEQKLGGLAMLRNIRNMECAWVSDYDIAEGIANIKATNIMPIRYVAAARIMPKYEAVLEHKLLESLQNYQKLPGKTALLVDVSGSMTWGLNGYSQMTRMDAANALAIILRELCEDITVYSFSTKLCSVPARRGFALADAIKGSQRHSSTYLGLAVNALYNKKNDVIRCSGRSHGSIKMKGQGLNLDRLIVITDEQSDDPVPSPKSLGYMINVASAENGVGYGSWFHLDGWSDSIARWIVDLEAYNFS
jgi:hypothetical protein